MTDTRNLDYVQAKGFTFTSGGAAYNLTLEFYPDYIEVLNYTQSGTVAKIVASRWYRGMPAGDAISVQTVDDDGSTGNTTGVLETTNGFTWAGADAAFVDQHRTLSGVTQASPAVCTTTAVHGLTDGDRVFITDVVGMTSLNANEYEVDVLTTTTFGLYDLNGNAIDSSGYTAWSSGGTVTMKYEATDTVNVAESFIITLGTGVCGADSDSMFVHAIKYAGGISALGDIG
jgi:hypothetical protein